MPSVEREGKETRSLSHKNDKCTGCGICMDICPTQSIKLGPILPIARGLLTMDYITIDNNSCCLCGLCTFSCPFDALDFIVNGSDAKKMDNYPQWESDAEINDEECIYCGRCQTACPTDAIYMLKSLPKVSELVRGEAEIDKDKCIYCGMCEEICPAEAVEMNRTEINSFDPTLASDIKINPEKCIYCGICKRICPTEAIKIVCTTCMERDEIKDVEIDGDILLDQDTCINCGWCQDICPVDAATVIKPFEGNITFIEDFTCKGESCHACKDVCPCNAISIVDNKSCINPTFCTLCGACAKACPQQGIVINREVMKLNNIRSKSWKKRLGTLLKADS